MRKNSKAFELVLLGTRDDGVFAEPVRSVLVFYGRHESSRVFLSRESGKDILARERKVDGDDAAGTDGI